MIKKGFDRLGSAKEIRRRDFIRQSLGGAAALSVSGMGVGGLLQSQDAQAQASGQGFKALVFLLLSGGNDKIVRLWDTQSGRLVRSMQGHKKAIWSVAFSPDGRTALSGGGDEVLKLWDLATGLEIGK